MPTHAQATQALIDSLLDKEHGCLTDMHQIGAIGHRIVNGGEWLTEPVLVSEQVLADLEKCRDIAPLHTVPASGWASAAVWRSCRPPRRCWSSTPPSTARCPRRRTSTRFPTSCTESIKSAATGFHGTSHRYVSEKAIEYLRAAVRKARRSSPATSGTGPRFPAVKDGKVIDTSHGIHAAGGIIMGSRCGSIDPAIVPFIMEKENIPASEMGNFMNKQCGLLGVSEVSSDLRDVMAAVRARQQAGQAGV